MEKSKSLKELIKTIKEMTYQWNFNTIIKLINDSVPEFFVDNDNILYIIMKFILIDKLRSGAQSDAQAFYKDYLIQILKRTHSNRFEEKNTLFLSLINNPNLCADNTNISLRYLVDLKQQTYFEKFLSLVEKLLLNGTQVSNNIVDYFSDYENEYCSINCPSFNSINHISSTMNLNNNIHLSSSTMPLFNVTVDNAMNYKTNTTSSTQRIFSKLFIVNKRATKVKSDNYSNYKAYSKEAENVQKSSKPLLLSTSNSNSNSSCSEQYFHPKYSRRVNICKKICRKFKKYLKERSDLLFAPFWHQFVKDNLLPPFKLEEEKIEFKSFSHNYLKWLFDHEGSHELYQSFINDKADRELKIIYDEYQIEDVEERKTLEKYFKEFCSLFSKKKTFNYDYVQSHLEGLQMIDKDEEIKKDELFDDLIQDLCKEEKSKRKKRTQFERSRDDFNVFDDNLIKSGFSSAFSSDKEE